MLTNDQRQSEQYHQGNPKTSEIQFFFGETQIATTHRGGRKSKPFSPGTDFVGLIFTGELSGVDSAGVLRRQGVQNQKNLLSSHYSIITLKDPKIHFERCAIFFSSLYRKNTSYQVWWFLESFPRNSKFYD